MEGIERQRPGRRHLWRLLGAIGLLGASLSSWIVQPAEAAPARGGSSIFRLDRAADEQQGPQLLQITVRYRTPTSFAVAWKTDTPASSEMQIGPTARYGQIIDNDPGVFSLDHQVVVTGLSPNATYHFGVQSRDYVGNVATDPQDHVVPPPATTGGTATITSVAPPQAFATTIIISWTTNIPTHSRIEYTTDTLLSAQQIVYDHSRVGDNGDPLTTTHMVRAVFLQPKTAYRLRIVSIPANGRPITSDELRNVCGQNEGTTVFPGCAQTVFGDLVNERDTNHAAGFGADQPMISHPKQRGGIVRLLSTQPNGLLPDGTFHVETTTGPTNLPIVGISASLTGDCLQDYCTATFTFSTTGPSWANMRIAPSPDGLYSRPIFLSEHPKQGDGTMSQVRDHSYLTYVFPGVNYYILSITTDVGSGDSDVMTFDTGT